MDELLEIAATSANRDNPMEMPESLKGRGTFTLTELYPKEGRRPRTFRALLVDAPVPSAGYGGWSRVARPRKKALTEWAGRDSLSMTLNFLLDNFAEGKGLWIETKCQILDEMAGVEAGDPQPPLLALKSEPEHLMPHGLERAGHNEWFVEALSWNQADIRYNRAGNRVRASGTIVVTQYVSDVRLTPSEDKRQAQGGGSKIKRYKIKKGDTLQSIAAKRNVYGDRKQWKKIAKANGIRDPKLGKKWWNRTIKIP